MLTAHDKATVRRVARALLADRDMGEESTEGDNVSLSTGYASVDVSESGATAFVHQRGRKTVRVTMSGRPATIGRKRPAGRKTSTRKKVPAKRANPRSRPLRRTASVKRLDNYNVLVLRGKRWVHEMGISGRGTDHTLAGVKAKVLARYPDLAPATRIKIQREPRELRASRAEAYPKRRARARKDR